MAFDRPAPEVVTLFQALCPGDPVTSRPVFGYPCAFLAGNMFLGLFADTLWVRLPEHERTELMALGGRPFEPMKGRPMKEYVVVPATWDAEAIRPWVARAQAYAETLPPKPLHKSGSSKKKR